MAAYKKTLSLLLALSACFCVNAFAAADTNGVAQLETTPPPAEGPLTADQIPPLSMKTILAEQKGAGDTGTTAPATSTPSAPAIVAPSDDVPATGR
jgi:hypothetical protein